jgi:hypothetical protein
LFEQLAAGAHRDGPWRCLSLLGAQFHHPLQRLLKHNRIGWQYRLKVAQSIAPLFH